MLELSPLGCLSTHNKTMQVLQRPIVPPNAGSGVHELLIINACVVFFWDEGYQLLANGRWFYPGTLASSTTKTCRHDIAEVLLKVALNTTNRIKSNNDIFLETRIYGCYSYSCIPNIEKLSSWSWSYDGWIYSLYLSIHTLERNQLFIMSMLI